MPVEYQAPVEDPFAPALQRFEWTNHGAHSAGAMLYDTQYGLTPSPDWLDPTFYGTQAKRVGQGGRQAAWFVAGPFGDAVLRRYQRGGLVARLSRDRYVWRGEAATRAFAECRVMTHLNRLGLSVPAPVAAGYWRHGLFYTAAILTQRIPDVTPLALKLEPALIPAIAAEVVAMHRAGAWHADLNAFNILVDASDRVWLIDFDKAVLGTLNPSQRQANLQRLARSLRKVASEQGAAFANELSIEYERRWNN